MQINSALPNTSRILVHLLIWSSVALLITAILVLSGVSDWRNALVFAFPSSWVLGFISSSAYYVSRSLCQRPQRNSRHLIIYGSSACVSGLTWLLMSLAWNQFCLFLNESWAGLPLNRALVIFLLITGVVLYLLAILTYEVMITFDNLRLAEKREAASEVMAREAELQMLRTQINPHFLFNSLNSISALTSIDPAGARQMTIELAQFFRQTLALSEHKKIRLADEIALCQHFISIEKIRFGKKLAVEFDLPDSILDALIPPMILQPLLENAIKHGIRDLLDGGTIHVRAFVHSDYLIVELENPIDTDHTHTSKQEGTGTGLKNLLARLRSLYHQSAHASYTRHHASFLVRLTLPLEMRCAK